jgi:hypothetical protein
MVMMVNVYMVKMDNGSMETMDNMAARFTGANKE